ncbi:MAG: bifunctional riboflavin kinase/FAD synthetase [Elusimicrobiales bacterium]|nr:bifunctional riboflavin kinase/FAD synthetase [Elusimicrobiales bacterium]
MKTIVLSIGSYDGVHLGHQAIIKKVKEISKIKNINSAIFFFEIPPKFYFKNYFDNILITLACERINLIKKYEIDLIIPIDFNKSIYLMSSEEFFEKFIFSKYIVSDVVVGKDFAIGYNRRGNIEWLKNFSKNKNFDVSIIDFVKWNDHKVSSSLVRDLLKKGDIEQANELLARPYTIEGIVKKGAGIGKKLGYPTANLEVDKKKLLPHGIFVVKVLIKGKVLEGIANIGRKPTFGTSNNDILCEVHIFDFNNDIYSENISILLLKKIRDEKKFDNILALKHQIEKDIIYARKYFKEFSKKFVKNW